MRPEKDEAKAEVEARKCEVETEAKISCEAAEAKTYNMRPRPQCLMNHATYHATCYFHIAYHNHKTDIINI